MGGLSGIAGGLGSLFGGSGGTASLISDASLATTSWAATPSSGPSPMSEWETTPAPNYPKPNYEAFGNALSNLFTNYQQSQENQQQIDINKLRQQRERQLLDQSKVFAGGVPMNKDGTPDYSQIMQSLARAGDVNAIGELAPAIQTQQCQADTYKATYVPAWGRRVIRSFVFGLARRRRVYGLLQSPLLESGNQNVLSLVPTRTRQGLTPAQGYDQIDVPTWRQFAPTGRG